MPESGPIKGPGQFAQGRRFRIFNVTDDLTKECFAVVVDTSISGRRMGASPASSVVISAARTSR
jgi:hypothetical protein